jgi:hypothetical protein
MELKKLIVQIAGSCLSIVLTAGALTVPVPVVAADLNTQLGFKALKSSSTPPFLNSVSQSVFEVLVPSAPSPEDVLFFNLNSPEFEQFKNRMASLPESAISKQERIVVEKQIENCRREKQEKQCGLFLTIEKATAFLAGGDGSYLLTNAHVVNRFLHMAAKTENKTVLDYLKVPRSVPIFLFDRSGNLVVDPYTMPPVLIKFGTPSLMAFIGGSGWYGDDSDYVVLQFTTPIGRPLTIANTVTIGESLYHLGFASCTGCGEAHNTTDPELNRDRKDSGNSDGKTLYWTAPGPLVSLDQAISILKAPAKFFEGSHKDNWIFFRSDSQVGMSGGPIVNTKGEVVGVYAGSKPIIKNDGSMSVLSRGVRPPEFDKAGSARR